MLRELLFGAYVICFSLPLFLYMKL